MPEQQRIVARIDELASELATAEAIGIEVDQQTAGLISATLNRAMGSLAAWPVSPLESVASIRSGVTLGRNLTGATVALPYLRVANVQDGRLDLRDVKRVEVLATESGKWRLEAGDLLMTEGGDWDKLGRCATWSGEISDCIHQNHIFCVRPDRSKLLPEYLAACVSSPGGKAYFQGCAKKTTNLASINQRQLRAFPVVMAPLPLQERVLTRVRTAREEVDGLVRVQSAIRERVNALLPAILDRAFAGAL